MTERYGYDKTPTPPRDYDVSKAPAEIRKRATWVRTKYTGEDVAEAYAQGMEITGIHSDEAKQLVRQNKVRQDALENQFDAIQRDSTGKDVVSSMEIVVARGGKATLGQRLDETTAQLAQTDNKVNELSVSLINFPRLANENEDGQRIQRAINYASSNNIRHVHLTDETFLLNSRIYLKDNIHLSGHNNSLIKVHDDCEGFRGYLNVLGVDNVVISNINFDGNGERLNYSLNNTAEIPIYLTNVSNVKVIDNNLKSNGIWSIAAEVHEGINNDNIYIERNKIDYSVGRSDLRADKPFDIDNTQIYIDAENYWIKDNVLTTTDRRTATAIEGHRRNGVISGNVVNGFSRGFYIVNSAYTDTVQNPSTNTIVSNNIITDCSSGIEVYPTGLYDLKNVFVSENIIEINAEPFYDEGVRDFMGVGVTRFSDGETTHRKLENVEFKDNQITYELFVGIAYDFAANIVGISLSSTADMLNVRVVGNKIVQAPGIGIVISPRSRSNSNTKYQSVTIKDNEIIDSGRNTGLPEKRSAIYVESLYNDTINDLLVSDNTIRDTRGTGSYFIKPIITKGLSHRGDIIYNNIVYANDFDNFGVDVTDETFLTIGGKRVNTSDKKVYFQLNGDIVHFMFYIRVRNLNDLSSGDLELVLPYTSFAQFFFPISVTNNVGDVDSFHIRTIPNGDKAQIVKISGNNNDDVPLKVGDIQENTILSGSFSYLKI